MEDIWVLENWFFQKGDTEGYRFPHSGSIEDCYKLAEYFLKYDRVKIKGWLFQKPKIYAIENIEKDFPELKPSVIAFIRLKSYQKKQTRIAQRINKLNKYYERPTELFARFIEGLYENDEEVREIAPITTCRFFELLNNNYYKNLKEVFTTIVKIC